MGRYYILLKRKGAKNWARAIPARKGMTKSLVQDFVKARLRTGYQTRIITETDFVRMLKKAQKK